MDVTWCSRSSRVPSRCAPTWPGDERTLVDDVLDGLTRPLEELASKAPEPPHPGADLAIAGLRLLELYTNPTSFSRCRRPAAPEHGGGPYSGLMSGEPAYFFGHSAQETRRLRLQAEILGGATRRMLDEAGIGAGMRVLDIGTGAGDVALDAARLVGPSGSVVGVDANPQLIALARERAAAAGLSCVEFVVDDLTAYVPPAPLDALVGRCVLFFLADPSVQLARLAAYVRPGGAVAFQEPGNAAMAPATAAAAPTFARMWGWILGVYERAGLDMQMGLRLHRVFVDAGLPAPRMHLDAAASGAPDWPGFEYMAGLVRTLLPRIAALGIATEDEIDVDGLADRLRAEAAATGCAVTTWSFVTAWAARTLPA
jgi:SAM-dependent methyltransferase